jgi:8-oxoguanine deaminase
MATLLAKNIHTLVTMDDTRREIPNGAIFVRDGVIEAVGTLADMPSETAHTTLDLSKHVVIPGLINTHHHMVQSCRASQLPATISTFTPTTAHWMTRFVPHRKSVFAFMPHAGL